MSIPVSLPTDGDGLARWVEEAYARRTRLVEDLGDDELMGPRLDIVNPLLWEFGHVAWFQERWVLRHALGRPPLRDDADAIWDSIAISHDARWDLSLPGRSGTFEYASTVHQRVVEALTQSEPDERLRYFAAYTVFHEDMHNEAFTYTRQTLAYPPPSFLAGIERDTGARGEAKDADDLADGDAEVPGGRFLLGAAREEPFVFDNEKWAHEVALRPFAIARRAVTQAEFGEFVRDGGYERPELWCGAGWRWRSAAGASLPLYWRRETGGHFSRRVFDRWLDLEPALPMIHANWYEADAYCRWAGRRLPSEAEWEAAAAGSRETGSAVEPVLAAHRRRFPWGDEPPTRERANLDWAAGGLLPAHALAAGESAFGCRQLVGNTWEWTATDFTPHPGFVADPYKEYSEPWFQTHKVLRGGCWATPARLLRNTWRNFYEPHRRDVWAGFRTCALDD